VIFVIEHVLILRVFVFSEKSLTTAFYAISVLMIASGVLQLSLISMREWSSLFAHVDTSSRRARRASYSAFESIRYSVKTSSTAVRRFSDFVGAAASNNTTAKMTCDSQRGSEKDAGALIYFKMKDE
jgi:hypothetical protein